MYVIETRRQSQAPQTVLERLTDRSEWVACLKNVATAAQDLCSLLKKYPVEASIGVKALGKVFEQLEAALTLGPAVSMLVLDVILVYELLTRLWELREDATPDSVQTDKAANAQQSTEISCWQGFKQAISRMFKAGGARAAADACGSTAAAPLLSGGGDTGGPVSTAGTATPEAAAAVAASSDSAGARGRGVPGDGKDDDAAMLKAAGDAIMDHYAVSKTPAVLHAALLRLALEEAMDLIKTIRRQQRRCMHRCMPCLTGNARRKLEDVKAAADFLSSARERFYQAVTVGKVFGEYAAEGITQLRAVQRGEMLDGGSILLRSDPGSQQGVKAKLYKVDAETNAMSEEVLDRLAGGAAAGPPDRDWQMVLESQAKCMAVTSSKLEQCSRDPVQLFLVKKGGELAAALCLCQQHGTGYRGEGLLMQPLANGYTAESKIPPPGGVYAPPLEELNFTTLGGAAAGGGVASGSGAAAGGGGGGAGSAAGSSGAADGGASGALPFNNCRAVFRMTVEQLRRVRDGGGTSAWDALCKSLGSSADPKHSCARCEAAQPKSIWADTSGAPGAPSYRMLVVCGKCRTVNDLKGMSGWVELHYSADKFTQEQKNVAWTHFSRLWGGADVGAAGADGGR